MASSHPARGSAPYARSPQPPTGARRGPPPGVSGMQVAGILFLVASVLRLVQHHLLTRWWDISSSATEVYSVSAVTAALGLGLLQGSRGARTAVLWILGLALAVVLAGGALALALAPRLAPLALWIGGPALLTIGGYMALLVRERHSNASVAVGAGIVVLGLGLSLFGLVRLTHAADPEFAKVVSEWAMPEHDFKDADSGVTLRVPEGWVMLKPGNPLTGDERPAVTLANPQATGFAVLRVEYNPGLITNDRYLEALLAARKANEPTMKELSRVDARVGQAPARAMSSSWLGPGRRRYFGLTTAWRDAERQLSLSIAMRTGEAAAGETQKLTSVIAFDAPLSKYMAATVAAVTGACPMLSASAVEAMAKTMPPGTRPETYFRQAYHWATRGAGELGAATAADLRAGMDGMLANVGRRDRARLDAYLENVRAGQPVSPADDAAMTQVVKAAVLALAPDAQSRLRAAFEQAVEIGRLL